MGISDLFPPSLRAIRIKCHGRIRSTSLSVISSFVRSYSFVVRGDSCPAICWACSSRPSFSRYIVMPVARQVLHPTGVREPAALARFRTAAQALYRLRARPVTAIPSDLTPWNGSCPLEACGLNVLVQDLLEPMMRWHFVLLAAFFMESPPTARPNYDSNRRI